MTRFKAKMTMSTINDAEIINDENKLIYSKKMILDAEKATLFEFEWSKNPQCFEILNEKLGI